MGRRSDRTPDVQKLNAGFTSEDGRSRARNKARGKGPREIQLSGKIGLFE